MTAAAWLRLHVGRLLLPPGAPPPPAHTQPRVFLEARLGPHVMRTAARRRLPSTGPLPQGRSGGGGSGGGAMANRGGSGPEPAATDALPLHEALGQVSGERAGLIWG